MAGLIEPVAGRSGLWRAAGASEGTPGVHALVIGISEYPFLAEGRKSGAVADTHGLQQLCVSAKTAARIFEWLRGRGAVAGKPLVSCRLLLSPQPGAESEFVGSVCGDHFETPDFEPMRSAIVGWGREFQAAPPGTGESSASFFFFSGHGLEHMSSPTVLARDFLEPVGQMGYRYAVAIRDLRDAIRTYNVAASYYFIDACRNTTAELQRLTGPGRTILDPAADPLIFPDPHAWLQATAPGHFAYQSNDPDAEGTFFGQALLEGLTGLPPEYLPYDLAGDPCRLLFGELDSFVKNRTRELLAKVGPALAQSAKAGGDPYDESAVVAHAPRSTFGDTDALVVPPRPRGLRGPVARSGGRGIRDGYRRPGRTPHGSGSADDYLDSGPALGVGGEDEGGSGQGASGDNYDSGYGRDFDDRSSGYDDRGASGGYGYSEFLQPGGYRHEPDRLESFREDPGRRVEAGGGPLRPGTVAAGPQSTASALAGRLRRFEAGIGKEARIDRPADDMDRGLLHKALGHEWLSEPWLQSFRIGIEGLPPSKATVTLRNVRTTETEAMVSVWADLVVARTNVERNPLWIALGGRGSGWSAKAVMVPYDQSPLPLRLEALVVRSGNGSAELVDLSGRIGPPDLLAGVSKDARRVWRGLWEAQRRENFLHLASARTSLTSTMRAAEEALQRKSASQVAAALGAALLLQSGGLDQLRDWPRNIANFFDSPDGALLWAETLFRRGAEPGEPEWGEAMDYLGRLEARPPQLVPTLELAASRAAWLQSTKARRDRLTPAARKAIRLIGSVSDRALSSGRFLGFNAPDPKLAGLFRKSD